MSEIETLKENYLEETTVLNSELEKEHEKCEELEQTLITKDKMLDDKNAEIDGLKSIITEKESIIHSLEEEKKNDALKEYYENLLDEEIRKSEKLTNENEKLNADLNVWGEDYEALGRENDELRDKYAG